MDNDDSIINKIRSKNCLVPQSNNGWDQQPSMNILPDECLIEIFHFLPISDRVRIERVCQRWKMLAKAYSWSNFKHLDFSLDSWHLRPSHKELEIKNLNINSFYSVLKRCARYLNSIDTIKSSFYSPELEEDIPLFDFCPNIQSVSMKIFSEFQLQDLSKNCKNLKHLHLYFIIKNHTYIINKL